MKLKICCFLLFFCTGILRAQESGGIVRIDSILKLIPQTKSDTAKVNKLFQIGKEYKSVDPENGIKYGEKALSLSKSIKWNDGIAKSLLVIGINNYSLGEIETAKKKYAEALKQTNNQTIISELYKLIGATYTAKADYPNGLVYNFKALKIATAIKNQIGIADALYNIGVIYHYTEDTKKSLAYFEKALAINTKLKRKFGVCTCLRAIATAYMFRYEYAVATSYLEKALKIAKEIGNLELQSGIAFSIGKILLEQHQYEQAIPYCIEARQNAEAIKYSGMICTTTLLEANVYVAQLKATKSYDPNLLNKAEKLIRQAIERTKRTKNVLVLSQCYKTLSDIYSLRNNHKLAKETYILYTNLQDSIYSEDSRQTIENLENQRTIDLKNNEIQIAKLKVQTNEQQRWFYIFGIAFLAILGMLLFFQNQIRSKTNQKLQLLNGELDDANKNKALFFSILNHDLRSPVTNLIAFLQIQKQNPGLLDEEIKQKMENKTLSSAQNLLESMEDILFWSKSQMENFKPQPEKVNLDVIFSDLKKHFSTVENIRLVFENPAHISIFTDENYLKTILRNLIANAIKALEKTSEAEVVIKAFIDNGQPCISVVDNGPGGTMEKFSALYDEKEVVGIKTGLGLHLIRDLAKAINCKICVHTNSVSETTFKLLFQ